MDDRHDPGSPSPADPSRAGPRRAGWISRALAVPLIVGVRAYQVTLGPFLGGQCRFEPSCSRYALDALREHGAWRGGLLTVRRLGRCHPCSRGGYDPVPIGKSDRRSARVAQRDRRIEESSEMPGVQTSCQQPGRATR